MWLCFHPSPCLNKIVYPYFRSTFPFHWCKCLLISINDTSYDFRVKTCASEKGCRWWKAKRKWRKLLTWKRSFGYSSRYVSLLRIIHLLELQFQILPVWHWKAKEKGYASISRHPKIDWTKINFLTWFHKNSSIQKKVYEKIVRIKEGSIYQNYPALFELLDLIFQTTASMYLDQKDAVS